MELKSMTFAPNQDGEVMPETVTVTMTAEEALWIAIVSGKQRGESPHRGIYNCLTDDVFNRYWEGGVDDARKEIPVVTPPINYDE